MSEEKLDKILDRLNEISKWTKLQGLEKFSQIVPSILKSDEEKIAFELSNGIRSASEISTQSGIPKSTITAYWRKWAKSGIVEESEKFVGRMKHLVSLEEAGIDVPKISEKKSKESKND
ncbi:hypothetical protein [Nitrosopumilus sp.]|uniref:hypothetical protein n=1 Tax=Nitrosopumilus sp. TaxID=2024843 RepID=UPI003D12D326